MKRRYSGNDKHWGPFTFSKHSNECWRPLGVMLDSGGDNEDGGNKGCNMKLHGFGCTLIIELPRLLPDFRIKHIAHSWDAATVARLGRNYYYETFPREYGFTVSDGSIHVYYGPQTHDSTTTKSKVFFLPWRRLRFIRQSWYGPNGEHINTLWQSSSFEVSRAQSEWRYEFEKTLEKVRFKFKDYDGEEIEAATNIEEREWRFGGGWFKWISLFRRPIIERCLSLHFSSEVGPEKGSWKGGTTGHSIEMLPNELHESAFRRYCEQEHRSKYRQYKIEYIGKVSE